MTRIEPLKPEQMTAEQKALHDVILGQRSTGEVRGPFAVLLHAPDIGERVADFVNHLLSDTRLSHRLKELAIITVARHYTAQYEWWIHARRAENCGLERPVIDAIFDRKAPDFLDDDAALVYAVATEMTDHGRLDQALYDQAVSRFGEPGMVELVALVGLYIMIAVFLNVFDVDVPDPDAVLLGA